jgi:hypothetical protein
MPTFVGMTVPVGDMTVRVDGMPVKAGSMIARWTESR